MLELCLFRDADESARTTSAISDIVLSTFVFNLSMESRDILINNMNLIFGVTSDHSTVFFERVTAENGRFTLLYDELIDFCLLSLQLSGLAASA
jgi:hypothetical protein